MANHTCGIGVGDGAWVSMGYVSASIASLSVRGVLYGCSGFGIVGIPAPRSQSFLFSSVCCTWHFNIPPLTSSYNVFQEKLAHCAGVPLTITSYYLNLINIRSNG